MVLDHQEASNKQDGLVDNIPPSATPKDESAPDESANTSATDTSGTESSATDKPADTSGSENMHNNGQSEDIQNNQRVDIETEALNGIENSESLLSRVEIDNLPVTLSFEMGRVTIPLSECRNITPSQVFTLSNKALEEVKLCLSGNIIAAGEVIRLEDGSIALRVKRLSKE